MYPYFLAVVSLISALIALTASYTAWRRSAPGSIALSLLLLAMAVWSGIYTTRWMEVSPVTKGVLFNLMFIGIATIPTLFLLFALGITHNESWLTPRHLIMLSIQPGLTLLLQWIYPSHYSYLSLGTVEKNPFFVTEFIEGPWSSVYVAYSYIIIGIAIALLIIGALRSSPHYRNQYRLALLGCLLPWAGNLYSETNFSALHGLDLTPLTFGISGMIFAFSMLRTRFLDLIPVARDHLIESMSDGVLVLDEQNRVIDVNPALQKFLEMPPSSYLGKRISEIFEDWTEEITPLLDGEESRTELTISKEPALYLDLRVTPLYDNKQHLKGNLLVFRDITDQKQVEKKLRYANNRLQSQLIEIGLLQSKLREQAIRDPLTNLFNRRYLEETLERELARAAREEYPVCILMLDLDYFKRINDTYGHEAGDHVLRALANMLTEQSRRGDFACRYGGEEFVIVMPNISLDIACKRAEVLRQALGLLSVSYGDFQLSTTISMGIACYPEHGGTRKAILRAADKAMYAAKDAGRDHIFSYNQLQASNN